MERKEPNRCDERTLDRSSAVSSSATAEVRAAEVVPSREEDWDRRRGDPGPLSPPSSSSSLSLSSSLSGGSSSSTSDGGGKSSSSHCTAISYVSTLIRGDNAGCSPSAGCCCCCSTSVVVAASLSPPEAFPTGAGVGATSRPCASATPGAADATAGGALSSSSM